MMSVICARFDWPSHQFAMLQSKGGLPAICINLGLPLANALRPPVSDRAEANAALARLEHPQGIIPPKSRQNHATSKHTYHKIRAFLKQKHNLCKRFGEKKRYPCRSSRCILPPGQCHSATHPGETESYQLPPLIRSWTGGEWVRSHRAVAMNPTSMHQIGREGYAKHDVMSEFCRMVPRP